MFEYVTRHFPLKEAIKTAVLPGGIVGSHVKKTASSASIDAWAMNAHSQVLTNHLI